MSTTLRLSTTTSTSTESIHYLTLYEQDTTIVIQDKIDSLKLLRIIIKNLCDPTKVTGSNDSKYRQLKLSNTKIQSLLQNNTIVQFLYKIGFIRKQLSSSTDNDNDDIFELPLSSYDTSIVNGSLIKICAILEKLETITVDNNSKASATKKPILLQSTSTVSTTDSSIISLNSSNDTTNDATTVNLDNLTEKQRARILQEEQQTKERIEAKLARKRTSQQIQNDKYIRLHDPNWKPSVSAAAEKNGTLMQSFRDKYGES